MAEEKSPGPGAGSCPGWRSDSPCWPLICQAREDRILWRGNTRRVVGSFLADFLDAAQVSQVVVIGHSLGGLAAVQMALDDRGQRVCGLALVDSAGLGREINPVLS